MKVICEERGGKVFCEGGEEDKPSERGIGKTKIGEREEKRKREREMLEKN